MSEEEETLNKDEEMHPLEVKVINQIKNIPKEVTYFTETDDPSYENIKLTPEQVKELLEDEDV